MKHLSIRSKICLLLVTVLVPMIILQSAGIVIGQKRSIDAEFEASRDYAEVISAAFTNYLEKLWDTELAIGMSVKSYPGHDINTLEAYMKEIMVSQPTVLRYSWLSPDGTVIASTQKNARGIALSDREYVRRILSGEEKVVSGIIEGRLNEDLIMPVARGIRQGPELMGIVVAAVDVGTISSTLPQYRGSKDSSFGIVDKNGMIVFRNNSPDMPFDKRHISSTSPAWKAINGTTVYTDRLTCELDGTENMAVDVPINKIRWECFVTVPVDEVLEKGREDIRKNIIVLLLVILVSFAAAYFAGRRVLRPIEVLKEASRSITNGDLNVRTRIKGSDELAAAGRAFDQMAERIQQLEINRQMFLQTSAHELRNPMTSIKGIVSLILRRINSGKPVGDIANMMIILEKEVDRLSRLLSEIIEAFRVQGEDPGLKANYKQINITDVITSALKPFQAADSGHFFTFHPETQDPMWVFGDFERLEDVLRNLFGNAVKYSPEGTIVHVDVEVSGKDGLISVKDQGIGIPEDQIEKIFESFYRSDNLKGNDPGGMGLGLYICRNIIRMHGGSIWAENNKDKGSTFYIKIPLYNGGGV